jgi:hypothetical protein
LGGAIRSRKHADLRRRSISGAGDAADALWREVVRRATGKDRP